MLEPRFLLLDEPATGVAPPLVAELARLVRNFVVEGMSFGIVEHDMDIIARLCDRVSCSRKATIFCSAALPKSPQTVTWWKPIWGGRRE